VTVLLVTHRLGEVTAHADRATVLRRGRVAGRFEVGRVTGDELARAIVGEGVVSEAPVERRTEAGEVLLEAREVTAVDGRGVRVLNAVSFALRRGEVAGVAGVAGNGQAALALALTGRMPVASGRILLNGEEVAGRTPAEVRRMGVACIPEDRDAEGLIAGFSVVENAVLGDHREARFLRGFGNKKTFTTEDTENTEKDETGKDISVSPFHRFSGSVLFPLCALCSLWLRLFKVFDREAMRAHAEALVGRFDVRVQDVDVLAGALSGGNRQKVVVGRELGREPGLIVAEQPTRGLDIRATAFVQGQLIAARDRGAGVLLISQDLEEILRLSDRVLVMVRGRIVADLPRGEADEERIGKLMMNDE
jgi:simple sugar transport system ATP-binding protein